MISSRKGAAPFLAEDVVSNVQATGDNVTCFVQIATDTTRREGIAPLEESAEFLIQEGKIKSYQVVSTPESMAKLKAVMRK